MRTQVTPDQIKNARRLRQTMTGSEARLWAKLRGHRLLECQFRRQAPIGPYVVDFVCHEHGLVVEVDGEQHGRNEQASKDRVRDRFLATKGYRVLRFGNGDVQQELESVLMTMEAALEGRLPVERFSALPPSQPSPARGEGSSVAT